MLPILLLRVAKVNARNLLAVAVAVSWVRELVDEGDSEQQRVHE